MFVCLKRRHYNKTLLIWLSNISQWKSKELYELFSTCQAIFDEYPVENTHSIIRAQAQPSDTAEKLRQRAKCIFQSKTKQANFRSNFTPPKQFHFSQQQVKYLKVRCAEFLTNIFIPISNNLGAASTFIKTRTKLAYLPHIFGLYPQVKYTTLPLGFHTDYEPNEQCKCDLKSCSINASNESWKIFRGYSHSFHRSSLDGLSFCPICKDFLKRQIQELGNVTKNSILYPNTANSSEPDLDPVEETQTTQTMPTVDLEEVNKTINDLNDKIKNLEAPPQPTQHHQSNLNNKQVILKG